MILFIYYVFIYLIIETLVNFDYKLKLTVC